MPPYLNSEENVRRLASKIGEFKEFEDPARARGFLRVKIAINTSKPLTIWCWLPSDNDNETWIEFRYKRLQDFCYRCGRIGHSNIKCSFKAVKCGIAGYGEWTKTVPVRDFIESPRRLAITSRERRYVGATRMGYRISNQ